MLYPISLCFPSSRILPMRTIATKDDYVYTQREKGFDSFKHLEILAAGSVPLYQEPWTIPKFTMTHYNRGLLDKGKEANPFAWRDHFMKYLTAPAMVRYICDSIGVKEPKSVLFMDNSVPLIRDYLSLGLFYGCKELFGDNIHVLEEIPYAYEDFKGDFDEPNCARILPESAKSKASPEEINAKLWANEYDLVLFPSIMRGTSLHNLQEVLRSGFPREKIALCIGEDKPFSHWKQFPVVTQMVSDFNLFVRELD